MKQPKSRETVGTETFRYDSMRIKQAPRIPFFIIVLIHYVLYAKGILTISNVTLEVSLGWLGLVP